MLSMNVLFIQRFLRRNLVMWRGSQFPSEQLWTLSLSEQKHESLCWLRSLRRRESRLLSPTNNPGLSFAPQIITANPWNTIALLCGAFLALFKAAEFAKLSVKWMIKIRKRYLKRRGQATNHISWGAWAAALRQTEPSAILYSLEGTLQGRTDNPTHWTLKPGPGGHCSEPRGKHPVNNLQTYLST